MNKITFGRADDCDIKFEDKSVSRHHGYLHIIGSKVYVVDDDSLNGILVNGRRIKGKTLLSHGDEVKIANKFSLNWEEYANVNSDETILYDGTSRFDSSVHKSSAQPHSESKALIDIPSKMEINQNYAEVYRNGEEGADWKVPLKRNVGERVGNAVGSALGCILSIVIAFAFLGLIMLLF